MAITHTFNKHQVFVTQEIPNHPNVITRVVWSYVFTDGTYSSTGVGATDLFVPAVLASGEYDNLLKADTASDADIEAWVQSQLDWAHFSEHHTNDILKEAAQKNTTEYFSDGTSITLLRNASLVVPLSVTMRQARLALLQNGLLSVVEDAINLIPEPDQTKVRTEWEYAARVERNSVWVSILQPALGLTDQQMDDLFTLAAKL